MERRPFAKAHVRYLVGVGTAGWALLLVATALKGWPLAGADPQATGSFLLFLAFCLVARFLAFETLQGMAISLDSAFYIAAIWTLGPLPAAWIGAIVLFIDGIWRTLRREVFEGVDRRPLWANAAQLLYATGAVSAQFLLVGWIIPVDTLRSSLAASPQAAQWWVLAAIPFLTLAFLAVNYGSGILSLWLQGHRFREVVGRLLRQGILAECLQIPLSVAVVQVFRPTKPLNFILLGATFLLISAVFRKLSQKGVSLQSRVNELTTLNKLGRAMSGTLHVAELQETIARCTLPVIDRASALTLGLRDDKTGGVRYRTFLRDQLEALEELGDYDRGLRGWVLRTRQPLLVRDLEGEDVLPEVAPEAFGRPVRSWVGVPLIIYDEVLGILAVESPEPGALGEEHQRLLESIAQQAAVAIDKARLYELATVDGLTQLYVRRYFDQRLEEEWRRSARYHTAFALILLDLDDFKQLNDRYGHQVGDRILREVAAVVKRGLRGVDIAARYGGEEFAVILPRANADDASRVADRIRADLAGHQILVEDQPVSMTASFGVASYPECGRVEAVDVLHRADLALYEAKDAGKNRVCVYRADSQPRMRLLE